MTVDGQTTGPSRPGLALGCPIREIANKHHTTGIRNHGTLPDRDFNGPAIRRPMPTCNLLSELLPRPQTNAGSGFGAAGLGHPRSGVSEPCASIRPRVEG